MIWQSGRNLFGARLQKEGAIPYRKKLTESSLSAWRYNLTPDQIEAVKQQFDAGVKVEEEFSSFKDPGEDYCRLYVNDVLVCHVNGY